MSELPKKLKNYRSELESELTQKTGDIRVLQFKHVSADEEQYQKLMGEIKELARKLEKFSQYDILEAINDKLNDLTRINNTSDNRSQDIDTIREKLDDLSINIAGYLKNHTTYSEEEIKNAKKTTSRIQSEIVKLNKKNTPANRALANKMADDIIFLTENAYYTPRIEDSKGLQMDLSTIANPRIKKEVKKEIIDEYMIENYLNVIKESILNDMRERDRLMIEKQENEKNKKKQQKATGKQQSKKGNDKVERDYAGYFIAGGISAGSVFLACISIWAMTRCAKDNKNQELSDVNSTNNPDKAYVEVTDEPTIDIPIATPTPAPYTEEERITAILLDKGYDEDVISKLIDRLDKDDINALLAAPYYDYNFDYENDYFIVKQLMDITFDKAVDYVNRAYKIQKTGFYEDATIYEIVEILNSIDNKSIITTYKANDAQSFNTSFNRIMDNYLFAENTDEDIYKLEAISYFADENTDLGNFLSFYGPLVQKVVQNPNDNKARKELINYVDIFARSLNGFKNDKSVLTNDELFDKSAIVNDYLGWYIAYESFVKPLYPTLYSKESELIGGVDIEEIANIVIVDEEGKILEEETRKARIAEIQRRGLSDHEACILESVYVLELQNLMETALEDPEIQAKLQNFVGQCRVLGGN